MQPYLKLIIRVLKLVYSKTLDFSKIEMFNLTVVPEPVINAERLKGFEGEA
tara:strand:- start:356 stop:508 length:153 start_codon:yes stop_codon:yes gene_type:complete